MSVTSTRWERRSLESLSEQIDYGHTASANNSPVGPQILRITDIQNGSVSWPTVPFCKASPSEINKYRLSSGDIVFARTGNTTGKSFLIKKCPKDTVFASYLIRVRPTDEIEPRYLGHFFDTPDYWAQISKSAQGAGQPGVNASKLKQLKIPLPPLSEQKRIADILDKADTLRRKRREAIEDFNLLSAAIFNDMFSHKMTTSKWSDLSEYLVELRYGTSNKAGDGGFVTLRIPNIVRGIIDLTDLKTVEVSESDFKKIKIEDGDILFVRTNGNPDYVGRCAVFDSAHFTNAGLSPDKIIYASYLIRARLQQNRLRPVFLQSLLQTVAGRKNVREKCRTSAGQYNINTKGIGSLQIPNIPVTEQIEFESRIKSLDPGLVNLTTAQLEADDLFNSLVQRAFKGEL